MSISDDVWQNEQAYVNRVTERMHVKVRALSRDVGTVLDEVIDIRRHFWDDVTVNIGNTDDLAETHFAIRQQAEVLSERERRHVQSTQQLKALRRQTASPFFARIDFQETGLTEIEPIYIGIHSFRDDELDTFLVYDWRAPISSLYYDYAPGPVTFQAPGGDVNGEMTLKRQYIIRDGCLEVMFDASVTIGDELLMHALGRQADTQMKQIVATIQREQNAVIRNDVASLLVVTGTAGSGKTSAALQRVAYLLYKHRGRLDAKQILLFSPNPMFNSYVSTVLPELGEENMQQTTFDAYVMHRLSRRFQLEDPFDHLEYLLTENDSAVKETRLAGIAFKSSSAFAEGLRRYVDELARTGLVFRSLRFREDILISASTLRAEFIKTDQSMRLPHRLDALKKWILSTIDEFVSREWNADWVDDEVELLSDEDVERAQRQVQRETKHLEASFDDHHREREILGRLVLNRHLKKVRNRVKRLQFVDVFAMYMQWYKDANRFRAVFDKWDVTEQAIDICKQTLANLEAGKLFYEDATPYLYFTDLILGQSVNTSVRHVFVDEVQDYSILQLEVIQHLFPRSRMTLLGDLSQSIFAHRPCLLDMEGVRQRFGPDKTEVISLHRSYRSTFEIVQFTRGMAANPEQIIPFERHGPTPRLVQVENQAVFLPLLRSVLTDIAERNESVAIICKTQAETDRLCSMLQSTMDVRRIDKSTVLFEKGIVVIPAYLAKGVEFDAVIIADASQATYHQVFEKQLFYTACTRAMHELIMMSIGVPNAWVAEQPAKTYVVE